MPQNRLAAESSPYLLQHQHNPVDWRPWGRESLALAQESGRPILLSVGYAACHWCHVMAHESFENGATADLMNRHFINIKVDREERPDIDGIYQNALALLGEQGGWPLTMFLTPKGEPFWGGTYFPPEPRYGRPGFPQVLEAIAAAYRNDPEKISSNVRALGQALERLSDPTAGDQITDDLQRQMARRLLGEMDPVNGGLGRAPKFPQPSALMMLWRQWRRAADRDCRDAVLLALTRMSEGGIYDHLGGGYARYSVDERWLAPHFEKMLYDNAQILDLLTLAHQQSGDPLFARRREETIGWLLREMIAEDENGAPSGAFAATLDADSEGEEGRFYVWREAEIDSLLEPEDAALFKQTYDVDADGNWEGKTILNRLTAPGWRGETEEARLAGLRQRLLEARNKRVRPGWDDKVLADWNGLMIAALSRAAFAAGREDWRQAAERAFAFVTETLGEEDRLHHSWRRGLLRHRGMLEDYANMIEAALALHQTRGDSRYLKQAETWTRSTERLFADQERGGFFTTAEDADDLILRTKSAHDAATPSGNGVMARNYAQLFHLTGKTVYRERAEATIAAFSGELERNFFALCSLVNAADLLKHAATLVIIGDSESADSEALVEVVRRAGNPNVILQRLDPKEPLPEDHPAAGKEMVDGQASAYLCRQQTCSLPITAPESLEEALKEGLTA